MPEQLCKTRVMLVAIDFRSSHGYALGACPRGRGSFVEVSWVP